MALPDVVEVDVYGGSRIELEKQSDGQILTQIIPFAVFELYLEGHGFGQRDLLLLSLGF